MVRGALAAAVGARALSLNRPTSRSGFNLVVVQVVGVGVGVVVVVVGVVGVGVVEVVVEVVAVLPRRWW